MREEGHGERERDEVGERLHFYDAGGAEIGEPLLASYAGIADMATVLFMR